MDLATLGLAVDSAPARQGAQDLDQLTASAVKTEKAVDSVGKSTEQAGKRMSGMSGYSARLLREMQQMRALMEQVQRATSPMGSSFDRAAEAMQKLDTAASGAASGMAQVSKQAQVANDNLRLTGNQLLNLSRQGNDAITMWMSGADAMAIFGSQAGQVIGALEEGPGGLRGSLNAIGASVLAFAVSLGPAALGLAAFTAAVGALAYAYRETFPDMDATLKKHGKLIDNVAAKYEGLADRVDAIKRAASSGLNVDAGALGRDLLKIAEEQAKALQKALVGADGFFGAGAIQGADPLSIGLLKDFGPISRQVEEYRKNLAAGRDTTIETRQALADLYREAGENGDTAMQKAIEKFFAFTAALARVNEGLRENRAAIDEMGKPRSATDQLKIDDPAEYDRQMKFYEDIQKEIDKAKQKNEEYAQSVAGMKASLAESVDALRLQVEHFGETEGAIAAAAFAAKAMADAQRAATAAGRESIDPTIVDEINRQAASYGEATDKLKALNDEKRQSGRLEKFDQDLEFRQAQLGRSEVERRVAQEMRTAGLEYGSAADAGREATLRFIATQEAAQKAVKETGDVGRDAFEGIIEALMKGENAVDGLIGAFAQLGQRLAQAGLDKLLSNVFGTMTGGGTGRAPTAGGLASMVVDQVSYAAPIGKVTRGELPPLVTGAGFSSARASQVAGASVPAQMWNFFSSKGLSRHQIAGILGNAKAESAFNPAAVGDAGHAFGLFQWNDRGPAMKRFVGDDWRTDVQGQLDFAWKELQTSESRAYRALLQATDVVSATEAFLGFERPSGYNTGVRNSHNYSGRVANAQAAYGQFGDGDLARAVEVGSINATRKVASGQVPGVGVGGSSWGPQFDSIQNVSPTVMRAPGGGKNLIGGTLGGIGLVANAYQSGDMFGGALSGAMGGMELAPLFGVGGPVGAIIGAGLGLLGGALGGRSKKKAAEREAKMQADQAWSQNYNSLLDLKDTIYRTPKGALSGQLTELERTLDQFAKLADATKDGGNKRHIEDIRDQLSRYSELLKSMFRDTLPTVLEDLSAGRGLDTAFTKARDSVQAEAEAYRGLIEDVKLSFQPDFSGRDAIIGDYKDQVASIEKQRRLAQNMARVGDLTVNGDGGINDPASSLPAKMKAFGENLVAAEIERDKAVAAWEAANADVQARYDEAVGKAITAAREGLLRIVSGDVVEQSDIEAALAEARGAAAGLDVALKDLGMSAEEAATAIQGALDKRIALLAETFTRGLQDQIDELDGKGYLAGFRDLIEQRDTLLKDASLINVDTSLVSTFFQKQAQTLVDGAELAGDGFAELIKLFPELSGVVTESADAVEKLKDKLRAITDRIEGYDERRFSATEDTSTLSGATASMNRRFARERYAEGLAGGEGMLALEVAQAAERVATIQGLLIQARQDEVSAIEDTINRLEGLRDEWKDLRDSLKLDDTLSPLSQYDQFIEAQKQFRDISAKAAAGDEDAQAKLAGISQSYLEEAKAYYASSEDYYAAFREVQGVLETAETLASRELAIAQSQLDVAKAQLDAMTGVKDSVATLAEALTVAMAALAGATKAATGGSTSGGSFVPKNDLEHFLGVQYGAILGRAPDAAGVAYYQALRDQGATADQLIAYIKNSPEAKARGYAFGGLVSGPGTGTSDSIMARLSAGEFVMPARAVTPQTLPMLEGMRSGRMAGNDNAELIAEVRGLRAEVRSLRATVAEGELANVAATRAGVAAQQAAAVEQKKAASR